MRQPGMDLGSGRFHRVRFELQEELTIGGTAAAKTMVWSEAAVEYVVTDHEIEVVDALQMFAGQALSRGYATWWGDRRGYEVDQLQCDVNV